MLTDTHNDLLFFTSRGKVFRLKCYEIPQDISRTAKGTPLVNLVPLDTKERVTSMMAVEDFTPGLMLLMATCFGEIKKTPLSGFASVRSNGLIAMDLEEEDELVTARLSNEGDQVLLTTYQGKAVRFTVSDLRASSRLSGGVRGVRLTSGDRLVDMDVIRPEAYLLTITENAFGKFTRWENYPLHRRGVQGVLAHRVNEVTGGLAAARMVLPQQEIMLISAEGLVIRTPASDIPVHSRATKGVSLMRLRKGDRVVSIAPLSESIRGKGASSATR